MKLRDAFELVASAVVFVAFLYTITLSILLLGAAQ